MFEKFEKLYVNIGEKIKNWAIWMFIIEAVGAIISGFVIIFASSDYAVLGLLIIIFGPLVAFVSTWLLYGFGELIDRTCAIDEKLSISQPPVRQDVHNKVHRKTVPIRTHRPTAVTPTILQPTENPTEDAPEPQPAPKKQVWICTSCGRENALYNPCCTNCMATRPRAEQK